MIVDRALSVRHVKLAVQMCIRDSYYGAADTVVGMAFGYIKEIIDFTKRTSII